tara:strand:- start:614 stop:1144 length:531 start_codon:yes stop_codon:yes gene_type:complete
MKLILEQWRQFLQEGKFKLKGDAEFFRVTLPGIGYAQGQQHLRFKECQSDVDTLMETPEFLEAKEMYEANNTTKDMAQDENGEYFMKEVPAKFRPNFYDINNAWISNPEMRGKGYGKEIYKAFIDQAIEYAKPYGGVFIGAHHCTIGSGTSPDAKRVWKSLAREYNSSGDVIFIGL